MEKHLRAMQIANLPLYENWCRDNGFEATPWKTAGQFAAELDARERQLRRVAQQARLHRNPQRLIADVCDGKIDPDDIDRPEWKAFCETIAASRDDPDSRQTLKTLLLRVHDAADFLFETLSWSGRTLRYADALVKLNDRRGAWLRPLEGWRPQSHNSGRQFSALLRHLLCDFPVPEFMDQAWLRTEAGSRRFRDWFVHLGRGFSIRTAQTPFPLTKMMAHHFLQAPDDYAIEAALRWGQIVALGGDRRLVEAVLGTPIATRFEQHEFWTSVIRFFIANPMLDRVQVGPIVDFIEHQKFRTQEVVTGPGQVEVLPPPQPGLSMKGRSADALMRQMEEWHGQLRKARRGGEVYFKSSGIRAFRRQGGQDGNERIWTIRELLSSSELVREGRAMRHCVATYADSCGKGRCSIWSMEVEDAGKVRKLQTIEVGSDGVIAQCRGYANALPTRGEFSLIKDWAKGAGLSIGPYVGVRA